MGKKYIKGSMISKDTKKNKTFRMYPIDLKNLKNLANSLDVSEQKLFEEGLAMIFKKYRKEIPDESSV